MLVKVIEGKESKFREVGHGTKKIPSVAQKSQKTLLRLCAAG